MDYIGPHLCIAVTYNYPLIFGIKIFPTESASHLIDQNIQCKPTSCIDFHVIRVHPYKGSC